MDIQKLSKKDIPHVIELSVGIFKPREGRADAHHDPKKWRHNLKKNGFILGAVMGGKLAGYVFFYDKDPEPKTSHCWMAGVDERSRGQGILKALMDRAFEMLREQGYTTVTLNSYPESFPAMIDYLNKYGFAAYKEEMTDHYGTPSRKVFFRKKL